MTAALGLRIKSGHAVVVALAGTSASPTLLLRAGVALSDPAIPETRQPYHAGFGSAREDAEEIRRLVAIVRRCAVSSIDELLSDRRFAGTTCRAAALIVGSVIDPERVGNPHIRAHAREGRLFREVVEDALRAKGVDISVVVEKTLDSQAVRTLARSESEIKKRVAALGKSLSGPWRADEKAAATGAWVMLR
jgi:hypothetical protein